VGAFRQQDEVYPSSFKTPFGHMLGRPVDEVTVVPPTPEPPIHTLEPSVSVTLCKGLVKSKSLSSNVSKGPSNVSKGPGRENPFWDTRRTNIRNEVDMVRDKKPKEKKPKEKKPKEKGKGGPKSTFDEEVWRRCARKTYDKSPDPSAHWKAFRKEYNEGIDKERHEIKSVDQLKRKRMNDKRMLAYECYGK
jgi:hypothetical protein